MNIRIVLACAVCLFAGLAAGGFVVARHLRPGGHVDSSQPLVHVRNEFEFTVHATYKAAAPLFGADAERVWAGAEWDPHFLYPQPARDIPGTVFTVAHGHHAATWINTAFDLDAGHVQYVYVIPGALVTLIDIHIAPRDTTTTDVHVAYERTSLAPDANDHVRHLGDSDRKSGPEWGDAINAYFAKR
jgi:hypothetical protein